jgi:peptide/nickel transport system permease protein
VAESEEYTSTGQPLVTATDELLDVEAHLVEAPIGIGLAVITDPDLGVRARPTGWRSWAVILGGVIVGVVAIWVATAGLTHTTAAIRLVVGGLGLVALYLAFDTALRKRLPQARTGLWLASAWIILITLAAVFADYLPLSESKDPSKTFTEPILAAPDLFSSHPLGTDRQGLDILGGIIYGFRVSLVVGLGTVILGIAIGGTIGILAGYYRGNLDRGVDLLTNSMLAFPPLILLLAVSAVLERNVRNITLALAIVSIPTYIRLARANTLVVAQKEHVLAARALGARNRTIVGRDITPAALRPLFSYAFVVIAVIIVAEASLSFLGLSIPRPEPTLGNMIAAGQADFQNYPHLVFLPAIALFLTVLCLNRLGEEAQHRLDPRDAKL